MEERLPELYTVFNANISQYFIVMNIFELTIMGVGFDSNL